MSCPPAIRPGIMLVLLKLQKGKRHRPLLLLNSSFSGRRIHQKRYNFFFKWCKKHSNRNMHKEEWKNAEALKLSPSWRSMVLGGKGHPLQQRLFSPSILWAHLSSPAPMDRASMWTASQCQAGHSLLSWGPSLPQRDPGTAQCEGQGGLPLKDKSTRGNESWWINHPGSTASDGLIPEPLSVPSQSMPSGADAQLPTMVRHSLGHRLLAFLPLLTGTTASFRACFQRNPN